MFEFYYEPFSSGFLVFTIGALSILSIYHLFLYFQHKDKLYLLYGSYTFFIVLSQFGKVNQSFLSVLLEPIGVLKYYSELYTEIYYIIYFFFAFRFLNMTVEFPKWVSFIVKSLYALIAFCVLKFLVYLITGNYNFVSYGYLIFVALITVQSIIVYILLFKSKNKLRYYIIVGGLILSITSYVSLAHYTYLASNELDIQAAYGTLYIGFILENVLFSLGLGHKQKQILNDRNQSQAKVILQLKENERLKEQVQAQLEKDVEGLSKKAKLEKLENLKMRFDKELAELKVSTLRSQMNPHFIFNSLNSIKRYIIDNEKENAVYYLNKFSKLIRKILASSMEKEISLADEIETIELYVNIENIRFNNSIDFQMNVGESLNTEMIKIPSLILQPFIENAIWHGLAIKKEDKKLMIKIAKENDTHLKIEIHDNGIGRKKANEIKNKKIHKRDSVGIAITEERLKNFASNFKLDYELRIIDLFNDDNSPCGTLVCLKLPLS